MDKFFLILNAVICGSAAIHLIMFDRGGNKHKVGYSLLAWLLAIALAAVPVRTVLGVYNGNVDIAEVFLNGVICILIFVNGGNVAKVFHGGMGIWERIKKNDNHA